MLGDDQLKHSKHQRQQDTLHSASMLMPTDILNAQDLRILADLQSQLELLNDLRDVVLKGDIGICVLLSSPRSRSEGSGSIHR